jgi:UDP-N-acetylmuramoyl-tripeptide--D-alanyl-D-alanine ligase
VVELGMNHPGEIAYLAGLAKPTAALVNNAQREHLEFMETVAAVARENGEVLKSLPRDGTAVFPADDEQAAVWQALAAGRKTITFALSRDRDPADVFLRSCEWSWGCWQVHAATPEGELACTLRIAGMHNVKNALAAMASALAVGVPLPAIASGLSAFEPVKGRSRALRLAMGARSVDVIDDTYNANPDSMKAAIDVLAGLPHPRVMVMGDMGEVGNQGPAFHAEAGAACRQAGIEHLFALGEQSLEAVKSFGGGRHFEDIDDLITAVLAALPTAGSVLVKGSRFMKMERVVEALVRSVSSSPKEPHAA